MKKLKIWGAIGIFFIILMRPQAAVSAAQKAMSVWVSSVAPSLFPFLVLMPILTGKEACAAYEAMFSKWMRVLFRLPGAAAPAVIVGIIAGSPGGALALRHIVANSNMKQSEAHRIALALTGVSPAYLIMGVGHGLYGSISLGIKLAVIQLSIQLVLLILLREHSVDMEPICVSLDKETRNPIRAAVEGLLGICGYMVFFSIIAGAMASFIGEKGGCGLLLLLDLPSGLASLAHMKIQGKMVLMGAAIGFAGLCIGYQNMDVHKDIGLRWKDYLKVRGSAALLLAGSCAMLGNKAVARIPDLFEICMKNYSAALFIAGFMAVPGLYFLSKKLFLNNRSA